MHGTAEGDTQQIYNKLQANVIPDALTEMRYEKLADSGRQYYMILPRKYLFNRGIRILLLFLVCILACYKYFALPTPPLFVLAFRKFHAYCKYLEIMNVSAAKLRILLVIWICICIVLNFFFWKWIRVLF